MKASIITTSEQMVITTIILGIYISEARKNGRMRMGSVEKVGSMPIWDPSRRNVEIKVNEKLISNLNNWKGFETEQRKQEFQ